MYGRIRERKGANSNFYNGIMSKAKVNDKNSSTFFQVLEGNAKTQLRVEIYCLLER